jgi:hypothetical protein
VSGPVSGSGRTRIRPPGRTPNRTPIPVTADDVPYQSFRAASPSAFPKMIRMVMMLLE